MPTYLMSDSKCSVEAVVLDDGAASLRRADGADIGHAEGVAGVVATEVLDRGNTQTVKTFHSIGPLTSSSSFSVHLVRFCLETSSTMIPISPGT